MLAADVGRRFQQFGPFLIVRTLGRGGMGEVFIARTPWKAHPIAAVKRLRPDLAQAATFAERFQHESELAVRLAHPNVVGTLDVGSVDGQLYVASELVLGKDTGIIADRLRERGQGGPAAVAIRLMLDILIGLAYVHGARDLDGTPLALVHRDITPGNVLVSYDGICKLADFGLAKSLLTGRANLTQHGEILGTPNYLAPEVIRGEAATVASDLYGLGAIMYRFLTGVAPHQGSTADILRQVLADEPRSLAELRPDLSPWLVSFVHRLLAKRPGQRPSDARSLAAQLKDEAEADGLLVARAAVGRWLGELFADDKVQELEEQGRLIAMTSDDLHPPGEGTVVLAARPRSGSLFRGPSPESGGVGALGSADLVAGGLDDTDAQPAPVVRSLGEAVPVETTDPVAVADIEPSELDGMPTRAVAVGSGFAHRGDSSTDEICGGVGLDTDTGFPINGADDDWPTALSEAEPGRSDQESAGRVSVALPVPPPRRQRPQDAGSVVVAPVVDGLGRSMRVGAGPEIRRGAAGPGPARSDGRAPAGGGFPVPAFGALASGLEVRLPALRSPLLLVCLLAVAVVLGMVMGALTVSFREPSVAVVRSRDPLEDRLFRVQTRLVRRVDRGEAVPAEVWKKVSRAHTLLQAGDEVAAAALLTALEAER